MTENIINQEITNKISLNDKNTCQLETQNLEKSIKNKNSQNLDKDKSSEISNHSNIDVFSENSSKNTNLNETPEIYYKKILNKFPHMSDDEKFLMKVIYSKFVKNEKEDKPIFLILRDDKSLHDEKNNENDTIQQPKLAQKRYYKRRKSKNEKANSKSKSYLC